MDNTNKLNITIADLMAKDARFTRFNQAIVAAGLTDKFAAGANLTLFAPTNEAFARIPQEKLAEWMKPEHREQLKKLLLLHLAPGALKVDDLKKAATVRTEVGQELKVYVSPDLKEITLNNVKVLLPKIEAKNGYIYPMDAILQPLATGAAAGTVVAPVTGAMGTAAGASKPVPKA